MKLNPLFQAGLDVMERNCLVLGGGSEAEEKCGRLLDAGARITLLATELKPTLEEWTDKGRIEYHARAFAPSDLDGLFMVLNTTTNDPQLTQQVWELASARNLLINSYDDPEHSNFGMVALVHPGHLRLSISTSNASPSLASRLRQDLEKLFDEDFAAYLGALATARIRLREKVAERQTRFALLRALVRDFKIEAQLHYPPHWQRHIEALLSCDLAHCGDEEERCDDCPLSLA
jgi:precorrin-2 dehydrogenase/sirohydrochlorin ferrochelatase